MIVAMQLLPHAGEVSILSTPFSNLCDPGLLLLAAWGGEPPVNLGDKLLHVEELCGGAVAVLGGDIPMGSLAHSRWNLSKGPEFIFSSDSTAC